MFFFLSPIYQTHLFSDLQKYNLNHMYIRHTLLTMSDPLYLRNTK